MFLPKLSLICLPREVNHKNHRPNSFENCIRRWCSFWKIAQCRNRKGDWFICKLFRDWHSYTLSMYTRCPMNIKSHYVIWRLHLVTSLILHSYIFALHKVSWQEVIWFCSNQNANPRFLSNVIMLLYLCPAAQWLQQQPTETRFRNDPLSVQLLKGHQDTVSIRLFPVSLCWFSLSFNEG